MWSKVMSWFGVRPWPRHPHRRDLARYPAPIAGLCIGWRSRYIPRERRVLCRASFRHTLLRCQIIQLGGHDAPGFPVVGIGVSAGGPGEVLMPSFPASPPTPIPAWLLSWCSTWPQTTRASSPNWSDVTRMEVFEAAGDMVVRPNCAYAIPP
jgi:chemotaxis response regulator CheB